MGKGTGTGKGKQVGKVIHMPAGDTAYRTVYANEFSEKSMTASELVSMHDQFGGFQKLYANPYGQPMDAYCLERAGKRALERSTRRLTECGGPPVHTQETVDRLKGIIMQLQKKQRQHGGGADQKPEQLHGVWYEHRPEEIHDHDDHKTREWTEEQYDESTNNYEDRSLSSSIFLAKPKAKPSW